MKTGNFTIEDDEIIKDNFESLLVETGVDKAELKRELFAKRKEKSFMLKRQLVGFHLIQGLPDGEKRLPVEAYNRLATLLTSTFTKEDDGNILAWVDEHGPTLWAKWAKLADKIGKIGPNGGIVVRQRFENLQEQRREKEREILKRGIGFSDKV